MASSSSSSPSPQSDTCLHFITHLLKAFIDTVIKIFSHEENPEEVEQLPQAIASSSSSGHVKHQVFLSFRGEDTRLNFTAFLLEKLKATGMNVFFDEDTLEKGELLSPALSQGIAASNLSIILLSPDYASSKSCLAELSEIMHHKATRGHIVLPIFYHVDPSHVRNLGGSFKKSFYDHESKRLHQVQRWKTAFAEVGKLKGWHIEGGKFDKPEPDYIKDIVGYVIKKARSSRSKSDSEEYVGIDYQKETILKLIEQRDSRTIGLWGTGGIGKTTLANVVYKEVSQKFDDCCFLLNVSQRLENNGWETLRTELLSVILKQKDIRIDTPSIMSFYRERLNNKRVIVVLDDVNDSEQVKWMGVEYFGEGSKIIVTSRDKQVLKNAGAGNNIHDMKKLNENDSLQLFSTFAFQQLNPTVDFLDLSYKFVAYAAGIPLALKVLGSKLFSKSRKVWESEVDKLRQYSEPKISRILMSSFDELDDVQKNIFLDIAYFFKGQPWNYVEDILSCSYKGAVSEINSLCDKSLLDINSDGRISMHDMFEEIAKEIVCKESKHIGERSRLWKPEDVRKVLENNIGTNLIQGIKLDISQIDTIQLHPSVFENMFHLKYIKFYVSLFRYGWSKKLHAQVDIVSLPSELKFLWCTHCPFKSLSPSFNPKNLVVLKLSFGDVEQLWNEDDYQDLPNLKIFDVSDSRKLKKIPILSGATNLKIFLCRGCESLVELPCLSNLTYIEKINLEECRNLKKFPELPNNITDLDISTTGIEEVPDSIEHLVNLKRLCFKNCRIVKIPKLPRSVEDVYLSRSQVEEVSLPPLSKLRVFVMGDCKSLKSVSGLPPNLMRLDASGCSSLEKVSFDRQNLHSFDLEEGEEECSMKFSNCFRLNEESIDNIEANAMLKIQSLAEGWIHRKFSQVFSCCFPGNKMSANRFEYWSMNCCLSFRISPSGSGTSVRRFLVFAICLVVNITHLYAVNVIKLICEYQLAPASGNDGGGRFEKFKTEFYLYQNYKGDHVLILWGKDMVREDKNYEEASFAFQIKYGGGVNVIVEKYGVKMMRISRNPITILLQKQALAILVVKKGTELLQD
ncbi:hypothetical protein V6N13_122115 [Hibiscus sabdariffa]